MTNPLDSPARETAPEVASDTAHEAIPRGYWKNAAGSLVPVSKIKDIDKARNAVVIPIATQAKSLSAVLAQFKAQVMRAIDDFVALSAAEYKAPMRGAAGTGNVTLTSYDGAYKVDLQVADRIVFDERLQAAKTLIDACLHRWGKGANDNLKAIVLHAFRVDKTGTVSVGRVLNLRQAKIDDPDWALAMQAIADSMQAVSSVRYVRVYERNANGGYEPIPLNFSVL